MKSLKKLRPTLFFSMFVTSWLCIMLALGILVIAGCEHFPQHVNLEISNDEIPEKSEEEPIGSPEEEDKSEKDVVL